MSTGFKLVTVFVIAVMIAVIALKLTLMMLGNSIGDCMSSFWNR